MSGIGSGAGGFGADGFGEGGAQQWGTEVDRPVETDLAEVVSSELAGRLRFASPVRVMVQQGALTGDRRRFPVAAVAMGGRGSPAADGTRCRS